MAPLLKVDDLSIGFGASDPVVRGVSFQVHPGETLAVVGESGSGKTISCKSILGILPGSAVIHSGTMNWTGRMGPVDLLHMPPRKLRRVRGDAISMIFQEPMRALSPLHRIGNQVQEVLELHRKGTHRSFKKTVLETFERVGFKDPLRAYRSYPFEMSGGMRQRAMIAMAVVTRPELLIADEPTTALDVTTQAMVLGLLKDIQRETGMAVVLVTHDLGVVVNMADCVCVMNKGRVMEAGSAADVLGDSQHGYTRKLFNAALAIPDVSKPSPPLPKGDVILQMQGVSKTYIPRAKSMFSPVRPIKAVRGVEFSVTRGKTLAIVGESGSGKTTCARIALGAELADADGQVLFKPAQDAPAVELGSLSQKQRTDFQRQAQMVFQDPYSTLNPRMRVREALCEPMEIHGIGSRSERVDRAAELLSWVGMGTAALTRFPHAFSGGQRQRLSIARALMLDPSLLVCDEPTSALDVSVQEQVLALLEDIRDRLGLSYLFISHDLAVVARIADEVVVMRQGLVVEQGPPGTIFYNPQHPYTRALIAAQPEPDFSRPIDLDAVARGAGKSDLWPEQFRSMNQSLPALREIEPGHRVRCHA
ncbi:MAG: dipeptide ABC transporter ATP-binding protein [Pseudomonadota bacterium]